MLPDASPFQAQCRFRATEPSTPRAHRFPPVTHVPTPSNAEEALLREPLLLFDLNNYMSLQSNSKVQTSFPATSTHSNNSGLKMT